VEVQSNLYDLSVAGVSSFDVCQVGRTNYNGTNKVDTNQVDICTILAGFEYCSFTRSLIENSFEPQTDLVLGI